MTHIDNLFATLVEPLIIEQYKESTNWKFCLKSVIDKIQDIEDGAYALTRYFDIMTDSEEDMTSDRLEYLASLKNVFRRAGETDESLYERFIVKIKSRDAATANYIERNVIDLSEDTTPHLHEIGDLAFLVYTPNGSQIRKSDVKKLAAAGIMGIPAARIMDGQGRKIMDGHGRIILSLASDKTIGRS